MRERESIILLLFLFQICKGIIIRKESFNQKLMNSQDFRLDMYVLNSRYESVLEIPPDKMTYYQIEAGTSGIYNVSQGSSVAVNKYGTITPRNHTEYCYGIWCLSEKIEGKTPDRTELKFSTGGSTVTVIEGNNSYKISIYVRDYSQVYVEPFLRDYIETTVKSKENDLEKFKSIVEYAAQYPYEVGNGGYVDLVLFKKSDDWGSCNTINHLCAYIKTIRCNTRFAGNDPDKNTGHLNIVALIDGKFYIADVGYDESNNIKRPWSVTERNIGFSYIPSENGIIIYQYDGYDRDINVPSTIDGKTVIGFKYECFKNGLIYNGNKITKITLPNTITSLGNKTFTNLQNLAEVNIPIKVEQINMDNFIGCENLTSIYVNKDNTEYCSIDGILFNKNKTIIFKCPINNNNTNFTSPSSLKRIEEYAFNYVKNIEIANITNNVDNIGKYAFANSSIKEIYFYGEKPEFGENALLNLNITIYYPANNTTWDINNFDPLGAEEIRFVPWNPIEEKEEKEEKKETDKIDDTDDIDGTDDTEQNDKEKGFFDEHKTLIIIIASGIVLIIIGIIIFIVIRKRRAKTSDEVESFKGGLIAENMELMN